MTAPFQAMKMPMTNNVSDENKMIAKDSAIQSSVLDAVGDTPMIRLSRLYPDLDVCGKLETVNPGGSKKDRIGIKMIEWAEAQGLIKPGDTLVEPTSGNTGLGIAQAGAVKGYKVIITMPEKMSEEKRRLLRAYGAELILTPTEYAFDHPDGYIELAKRMAAENEHVHLLNQYANVGNLMAHYEGTGPEIWEQTGGKIDYFLAGMGTGGTISGVGKFLKEKNPDVKIIGIDPVGSIYSGGEPAPYEIEGIGYDFFPENLKLDLIDEMIRVEDKEAFLAARKMAKTEAILAGGSTGAVLAGLDKLVSDLNEKGALAGKRFVIMIHDSGRNYLSKIYNDEWMAEHGFL